MSDAVAPIRLNRAFERSGKSHAEVAVACEVTPVAVRHWLRGTRKPRPKYWSKLARVIGVAPGYFIGDFAGE